MFDFHQRSLVHNDVHLRAKNVAFKSQIPCGSSLFLPLKVVNIFTSKLASVHDHEAITTQQNAKRTAVVQHSHARSHNHGSLPAATHGTARPIGICSELELTVGARTRTGGPLDRLGHSHSESQYRLYKIQNTTKHKCHLICRATKP